MIHADEDNCHKGANNPGDCNDGMHHMSCVFSVKATQDARIHAQCRLGHNDIMHMSVWAHRIYCSELLSGLTN